MICQCNGNQLPEDGVEPVPKTYMWDISQTVDNGHV
jgi:hypothetical protein